MPTDQTPRTEAGRQVARALTDEGVYLTLADILAIEAQARAEVANEQHALGYREGHRKGRAEALDALTEAYHAMDAACRWAAGETAGVKTTEDADRHMAGYDALLDATVKAGKAAGILR